MTGNYLLDRHENDIIFHSIDKKCIDCDGTGFIKCKTKDDRINELIYRMYLIKKYRTVSFSDLIRIGRDIKNNGVRCENCSGSGVI